MRALLVGSTRGRARLRRQLAATTENTENGTWLAELGGPSVTSIEIAGEYPTLAAARRASEGADAIILASEEPIDEGEPGEALTPREHEVLALVAEGRSNKAIADALGISDQTVKFHVSSIVGKLGAANRTEAVRLAVRRGLIVL